MRNRYIFHSLFSLLLVIAVTTGVMAQSIEELLRKGRLGEAADSLSQRATADHRDGNTLYYQSFLETDASRVVQLLKASLTSGVESRYREDIYLKLARIYLLQRDYRNLTKAINDYRANFENGRYELSMLRLSALADEKSGRNESALRQIDRYLAASKEGSESQWGIVDKARVMREHNKGIGADKMLRRLSREKKGPGVPQALYLRALEAIEREKVDDAVFLYNLLREAYPSAVGLDAIVERLGSLKAPTSSSNAAEKRTGTYYSVKVGVFKKKANAKKQADIFKAYDRKIDIKSKKISGQKYYVVYVGRFTDWDETARFKNRLETAHGDIYQVVAR